MSGGRMSPAGGAMMRSMHRDPSVAQHKLTKGTARRIVAFARPFRRQIALFLVTVVIDALLVVATPLLVKRIIDVGLPNGDRGLIVQAALIMLPIRPFSSVLWILPSTLSSSMPMNRPEFIA